MVKPRCPICRSKKWRRDRNSGMVVCEEGHILSGYMQEDNEADGVSAHVTRKRKLRKNKTRKEGRTANPDLFHGNRLRFLFFQCAQIILRKQIRSLITIWGLPDELETVARDLWAMYVSLSPLEPEPYRDDLGEALDDIPDSPVVAEDPFKRIYEDLSGSDDEREVQDPSEAEEGDQPQARPERDQSDPDMLSQKFEHRKRKSRPRQLFDPSHKLKLEYTIVICYLSCLTLRVPILMRDLLDLVASCKVEYLEVLASIPEDMRKHIDIRQFEVDFLDRTIPIVLQPPPQLVLNRKGFADNVTAFARLLHTNFDIVFPDLNAAPVLWKCVQQMSLHPFLYLASRRILIATSSSMALAYTSAGHASNIPDVKLAAAVMISLKLLWGIDGKPRIPQDKDDIASALPRLDAWLHVAEQERRLNPHTTVPRGARSDTMSELSARDIDQFLDFYEKHLVTGLSHEPAPLGTIEMTKNVISTADKFFPLTSQVASDDLPTSVRRKDDSRIESFYASMSTPLPGEAVDDEPLFPGQSYAIWKSGDRVGVPDRDYARTLALMAETVGIDKTSLEVAIERMERVLLR